MTRPSRQETLNWIADAAANGIDLFFASDRDVVQASRRFGTRHCRKGSIPKDISKTGAGVPVVAFGTDELGNVVALCADGYTRQF